MVALADINELIKKGEGSRALRSAQRALQRHPKDPALLDALARSFIAVNDTKKALASYDRLIRLAPKQVKPLADKGHLLQLIGDRDAADGALRAAMKIDATNGVLLRMLSATSRLSPDDPVVAPVQKAWMENKLRLDSRSQAGFALAKIFGTEGFSYLKEANELQRRQSPWNINSRLSEIKGLKQVFSKEPWHKVQPVHPERQPIFVTGLPRSGTTLVEQILSCHSSVTAGGETGLPVRAAYSVLSANGRFKPMSSLQSQDLALIGQRYIQGVDHFHSVGRTFTDKSMQTYLIIGMWLHFMPQTKIIFVRRDPRDIGWSIFRNYFVTGTHKYSNKLEDIAAYIATVEDIMSYWRDRIPGMFLEVSYEALVTNPEKEIRRMLTFCELPFEEACLKPEENTAAVKTLSVEQVRQPISPKSIGGWAKFERDLEPLIDGLKKHGVSWE